MGRNFNGSTDIITLGSAASLDDIGGSPGSKTLVTFVYPRTYGENSLARIFDKSSTAGWISHFCGLDGVTAASNSFGLQLNGAVPGRAIAINDSLTLNKWWFLAFTYTPSDGGPRLWKGDLTTPVVEVTYTGIAAQLRQDVTTYASDAAETGTLGNNVANTRSVDAIFGHISVYNNLLTLGQLESLRQWVLNPPTLRDILTPMERFARTPIPAFYTGGGTLIRCMGWWSMQDSTNIALDRSGNSHHGTLTGTTQVSDPFPRNGQPSIAGLPLMSNVAPAWLMPQSIEA